MSEVKSIHIYPQIPDIIAWICQQRLQNSNKTYKEIWDYIHCDKSMSLILPRIFEKDHLGGDLKAQMSSYGLKGIRDRLSSLFLFHLTENMRAKKVDLTYVLEVQQFEERFNQFANDWDSRIFMLGFYLRMRDLKNEIYNEPDEYELNIPLDVDEILTLGKTKIEKLDWLILTIKEFLKYTDKDSIVKWLNESSDFYDLFKLIKLDEQKEVLRELLTYGHAIKDKDFFVFNKI